METRLYYRTMRYHTGSITTALLAAQQLVSSTHKPAYVYKRDGAALDAWLITRSPAPQERRCYQVNVDGTKIIGRY